MYFPTEPCSKSDELLPGAIACLSIRKRLVFGIYDEGSYELLECGGERWQLRAVCFWMRQPFLFKRGGIFCWVERDEIESWANPTGGYPF